MKLSSIIAFAITFSLALIQMSLCSLDFEKSKPSPSFPPFFDYRNPKFVNRKILVIQERVYLLGQYRAKAKTLKFSPLGHLPLSLPSIVDPKSQISDFEARYELAKILSRHKRNWKQALKQYIILQREQPNNPKLWFDISHFYTFHQKFSEALPILYSLVYHYPLDSQLLIQTLLNFDLEKKSKKRLGNVKNQSIISLKDQISDDDAMHELAKILARHEKSLDEALELYLILLEKKPHDPDLVVEASRIYIQQKKYQEALVLLYPTLNDYPENVDLLVEAARAEHGLQHPKQSQVLLLRALALTKKPKPILLDYASNLMLIGSFYQAEKIYREALEAEPDSLDLTLNIAWTLASAQRYEEAEGIYRKLLLKDPCQTKVLEALVTLKEFERDFDAALDFIEILLLLKPQDPSYLLLKANLLYRNESYLEALQVFDLLIDDSKLSTQAFIGKGIVYRKLGKCEESNENFQKAYESDPSSIKVQFYAARQDVLSNNFIQQVIEKTSDLKKLEEWANVYSENGMSSISAFYEAILKIDSDYFPARVGLASALSANYRFDEALNIYLSILEDFPENSKILLEVARVHSWAKNYECSIKWYNHLIALNPEDPVPRREKARVAYWAKWIDESLKTYQEVLYPSVDKLLMNALRAFRSDDCNEYPLSNSLEPIFQLAENGSIYKGYEIFSSQFKDISNELNCEELSQIESILIDYLPLYRIQKSFYLESYTKALDWQGYSLHALPIYRQLINFSPGNEEALFGYGQDYCNLGLCKCSRRIYEHILHIDPNHNMVRMAWERTLLKEHPLIQANYTYWRERGTGQFSQSQITRQQFDEMVQWSPSCDWNFRFIQREWLEYPFFKEKYYPAEGQSIEVDHIFNAYVKGSASATRKNYFHRFPSRYTCLATLWFNLYDYANLGIGFERRDEIYNFFTLKQGIQASVYWLTIKANSHSWETATTYRHYDYNDANTLDHINLLIAYTFIDDPTLFRIILNANWRNTAHLTKFVIDPTTGDIINVIHPYWTPQNYYMGSVTLHFRYNYAYFIYCEAPQRYLDVKVSAIDDTAQNPSGQLTFEWKHEFMYHLGFQVVGYIQRGRLWNADGFWAQAYYRF